MNDLPAIIGTLELQQIQTLGQIFKASGYFKDIRDEAQAITKIIWGRELGFPPIISLTGIFIVDGKPTLSANLLATMVKRSGKYDYRVIESTNEKCVILFKQRNDEGKWEDLGKTEFNMADAKDAGVAGKDNWRKYPKAMLHSRAMSAGVRAHCPDVTVCPLYVPEELGATVNEEGHIVEEEKKIEKAPVVLERPVKVPEQKLEPMAPTPQLIPAEKSVFEKLKEQAALIEEEKPKYISAQQAGVIARRFRESLPENMRTHAEELRHDALRVFGMIDNDGNPSASIIPLDRYEEIGKKLVGYARGLGEPADEVSL